MAYMGLLGLFLFLAVISLSLQSYAFHPEAFRHDLTEDVSTIPPTEKSELHLSAFQPKAPNLDSKDATSVLPMKLLEQNSSDFHPKPSNPDLEVSSPVPPTKKLKFSSSQPKAYYHSLEDASSVPSIEMSKLHSSTFQPKASYHHLNDASSIPSQEKSKLHSSDLLQKASYHHLNDASSVPYIEMSKPSLLPEFLPHNQKPRRQKGCKNKENYAVIFKLLKLLQQSDEDPNDVSNLDLNNDILDLNDDENSQEEIPFTKIDVVFPRYQNKRKGKVQATVTFILELPAPVTTGCQKSFSKLIEFTRNIYEIMLQRDECSGQSFDFNSRKSTRKPNYHHNTRGQKYYKKNPSSFEEESTSWRYPGNSLQDDEISDQDDEISDQDDEDYSGDDHFSTRNEPVPTPFDNIFEKILENYNPDLESNTKNHKTHKNINDEILSIIENGNNDDDSLYGPQIKHRHNSQNNVISLLQNVFGNKDNAHKLKLEPSFDNIMSVLHDYDTTYDVKDVPTLKPNPVKQLKMNNYNPEQNAQTDIDENFTSSPVADLESFESTNSDNFEPSKSPFVLDSLSPDYEKVTYVPTHNSFHHINDKNPKNYVLSLLEQATLPANKLKNNKHNFLSPFDEHNDNFNDDQRQNNYYDYLISQLGHKKNLDQFPNIYKNNGLYGRNQYLFKDKYGTSLNVLPETHEHNILPLKNNFNTLEAFEHQNELPALTPYQVNNVPTNSHSFDKPATNYNGYESAFNVQNGMNPYRVIATPNHLTGQIELTYLVKKPKPIVQTPTYYVKYRIPYQNYMLNLMKQEKLKKSPREFHNELIGSSSPIDFSPDLRKYATSELRNLVTSNGDLITATVEDGNRKKKIIYLKDVKDLKTLLAKLTDHEIDLPDLSFGSLENEERDSSVKNVISNLLETYSNNGYAEPNESSMNKYWEKISNITDEYADNNQSDAT